VYFAFQALWRTEELGWLADGLGHVRGQARRTISRTP